MSATIGGEAVELLNDSAFNRVRDMCGVSISDVSSSCFTFQSLEKGGGKGGSLMQFTKDRRLLVKELSSDDHASLKQWGSSYCQHVATSRSTSLLVRLFLACCSSFVSD